MQSICILLCSLLVVSGYVNFDDGTIKTSLAYEYDVYSPEDKEGKAILTVKAAKHEEKGRPVVSVTSVLDVSQSMDNIRDIAYGEKTRLDFLKFANKYVIDRLALNSEAHQYGAVAFSTDVRELTPLTTMTQDAAKDAREKIQGINATGRTNLFGGLMKGIEQQSKESNGGRIRVVLLFTDGLPTVGKYLSKTKILTLLKKALKDSGQDIIIHVFAVGETVNYVLLKEIAEIGGGIFDHVVKDRDIPKAFASVLGGILTEASLNLKYDIEPIGKLKVKDVQLAGAKIGVNGGHANVFMKDLLAEEARHVIITYSLDTTSNDEGECGLRVNGTYKHAVTHEDVTLTLKNLLLFKEGVEKKSPKEDVGLWNFRYKICKKLDKAGESIGNGDTAKGIRQIQKIRDKINKSKYKDNPYIKLVVKDLDMLLKYFNLRKQTKKSDEGMMAGLTSVIGGGRPQSVDDMFDTVKGGTTTKPKNLKIEVDEYVGGKDLKSAFELPISTSVSLVEDGDPKTYQVQLSVSPPTVTSNVPLCLTIVVDKDISNEKSKETFERMIDTVKKVVKDLKNQPDVHLGIILSSGSMEEVLNLTKTSDIDVEALFQKIDGFNATGGTLLDKSISKAVQQQLDHPLKSGIQSIFVITDGSPINTDKVCRGMKVGLAISERRIHVHAFAIRGCNNALLKNIASLGKGEYHDILLNSGIAPTVGSVLWGLLKVGATNIDIELRAAEAGVDIVGSLPEVTTKKQKWTMLLENMYQGEKRDLLLTVKAPKTAMKLLDVSVAYVDVLKPSIRKNIKFTVPATEIGSTKNRELDQSLVSSLEGATDGGLKHSRLSHVIDVVYDEMNKVDTAKGGDEGYKNDLKADLEKIADALEKAKDGDEDDLRYADWLLNLFKDILKHQRGKGAGHKVLNVQDRYSSEVIEKKVEEAYGGGEVKPTKPFIPAVPVVAAVPRKPGHGGETEETAKTVTVVLPAEIPETAARVKATAVVAKVPPKVKLPHPFVMSFVNVSDELTSAAQTITVTIQLKAMNASDYKPPPSLCVFIVDASASTKPEEIAHAKDAAVMKWKSMKDLPISGESSLVVLSFGAKVATVLEKKSMSDLDAASISAAFDGIVVGGEGSFKDGFEAAFDLISGSQTEHPRHELKIVAYVGDSIKNADGKGDAEAFSEKSEASHFPVTFLTATTKKDVDASYFDYYPAWMRRHIAPAESVPMVIVGEPLVKRFRIEPNPATGIAILGVHDGLPSDRGYFLHDLKASETQNVDIKLLLSESTSPQILHMPRLVMFDMRTLSKLAVRGQPLMIKRVKVKDVMALIDLQIKVNASVHDIIDDVKDEKWPPALAKTSETITDIDESGTDDDDMVKVGDKLKDIGKKMYEASSGDGSKDDVLDALKVVADSLDVRDPPAKPLPVEPIPKPGGPGSPKGKKGELVEVDELPIDPPELIFDKDIRSKAMDKKAKVGLTIKTTQDHGQAIAARTIILIDSSANAKYKYQIALISELLSSLANRDGKRTVEVWKASDVVEQIFVVEDFGENDIDKAKAAVAAVIRSGKLDAAAVLSFLKSVKAKSDVVTIVYWITASKLPVIDPAILESYVKHFKQETKVTVMTFKADKAGPFPEVLTHIAEATGGWAYVLFKPIVDVNEQLVKSRIQYAAWSSVGWIEKAHVKEVVVDFVAKAGALVSKIACDDFSAKVTSNSLTIPSVQFDKSVRIEIEIDLDQLTKTEGKRDVLDATMMYVLVRNPEIREMIDRTGTIEILADKTSAKVDTLNAMMRSAGTDIFELLGRNQIEKALKKTKDVSMQPKLAGLELSGIQETVNLYGNIGKVIEEYLEDRDEFQVIQKVPALILDSETEQHHYSDEGAYLTVKAFPPSTAKGESNFQPRIVIETPAKKEEVAAFSSEQEIISMVVVFDVAEYDFLIDDEVPMIEVQRMTVTRLMERLIAKGHSIDLFVVGSAYDHVKRLDAERFDKSNVEKIRKHLMKIEETGSPSNLLFGLKMGLPMIQEAKDSRRIVLIFTHASNVDLVEAASYQDILVPYITHPINPVKALTYMIGEAREWKPDTISALTGGRKIHVRHVMDLSEAVEKSVECIHSVAARSVRVNIKPSKFYENAVDVSKRGKTLPLGIVGDLSHNSRRTIDVKFDLGDWEGDKDLFEYSVSYYLPTSKRWFQTPSKTFRLRRVGEEVMKAHVQLQIDITPLLDAAIGHLKSANLGKASKSIYQASSIVHKSRFQDDSLIRAYSAYLTHCYGEIMKLVMTRSKDTSDVIDFITNDGRTLGLDIARDNTKSEEEPEDDFKKEESYESSSAEDDDDWLHFTPWYGFLY